MLPFHPRKARAADIDTPSPSETPRRYAYHAQDGRLSLRAGEVVLFDVIIAGGGPAGLSAALMLGRARRSVLICDTGEPRNPHSHVHGFLTCDGVSPGELRRKGLQEALSYGVEHRNARVMQVEQSEAGFVATLEGGQTEFGRRLLIATGVEDQVPEIPGSTQIYGSSLWHCPYCNGWEARDQRLGVLGQGKKAFQEALSIRTWSESVTLLSNGHPRLQPDQRERLARNGIDLREEPIACFEADDDKLQAVTFQNGDSLALDGIFFVPQFRHRSQLGENLGCRMSHAGLIVTNRRGETSRAGVYAAGDASHHLQLVAIAVGEGVRAAVSINMSLQSEERR